MKGTNTSLSAPRRNKKQIVNRRPEQPSNKKPGFRPALMDGRVKPGHDGGGSGAHNALLLSFTLSASRYTLLPISLNLALIWAMPSSIWPEMVMPTEAGSFKVAA